LHKKRSLYYSTIDMSQLGQVQDNLDDNSLAVAFTALYLAGGPRSYSPNVRKWPQVEHVLRRHGVCVEALRRHGLYAEALLLEDAAVCCWAERQVASGKALTVFSSSYPASWLRKLGTAAPPALWVQGQFPKALAVGIVGSRTPATASKAFAEACAARAAEAGMALVSGGASGCDAVAMAAYVQSSGDQGLAVLPRGLLNSDVCPNVCAASLEAPGAPFNRLSALHRNVLVYALSDAVIVIQPRFREGGTWHGAMEALRRRLSRVFVMSEPGNPACLALQSLGASSMPVSAALCLADFTNSLESPRVQPSLFPQAV